MNTDIWSKVNLFEIFYHFGRQLEPLNFKPPKITEKILKNPPKSASRP